MLRSPTSTQAPSEPNESQCVDHPAPHIEGNLTIEVGQPATLTYRIENNPLWIIWFPEGEETFIGETISVTLHRTGQYRGVAWGYNNCNHRVETPFTITVIPALGVPSITINDDAPLTRSSSVTLSLHAENATEMYITHDPTCATGGTWEPYSTTRSWTLAGESADARVYAAFRTPANTSACVSDGILYDITPPVVKFVKVPAAQSYSFNAHFEFAVSDNTNANQTIQCALNDRNLYQGCNLVHDVTGLKYGQYTMYIRAVDLAGNMAEDSYTWEVLNTPPMVRLLTYPPAVSDSRDAEFTFEGSDDYGNVTFECRVGNAGYTPCTSPYRLSHLANDTYVFQVRAVDEFGLVSTPASHTWKVNVEDVPPPAPVPPVVTLTKTPDATTTETTATFAFTATHSGVGIRSFYCALDGSAAKPCTSPINYNGLTVGAHTFSIYAIDNEDLRSETVSYSWEVLRLRVPVKDTLTIDTKGRKLDIVIVVDNSPSMVEEQKKMAARFSNFLNTLKDVDWQLGIITTDARSGNKEYQDGRLLPFKGAPAGTYAINASTPDLQKVFSNTVVRKEWGTDTEEGIHSILKMLQRPENRFMIREHSHFATVIISDEDERSDGKKLKVHNTPENLVATFQQLYGKSNTYSNHAIVLQPGFNPKKCPQVGSHYYGNTYMKLANMTGGVIGDICADDYGDILKSIGDTACAKTFTAVLKCEPVGPVKVTLSPTDPKVTYKVTGKELTLEPYPALGTKVDVEYYCD